MIGPALSAGPALAVPAADGVALAPVLAPVAALLLVLLLDVAWQRAPRRLHDLLALAGLAGAGAAVGWLAVTSARTGSPVRATLCVPGTDVTLPSCSFVASQLTLTLQAVVVVGAIVALLLAVDGPGARDRTPHHTLLLAAVAGALALAGARDLMSLTVAFETASLPVVALVALRRDAQGAQGALTLLLTAVASLGLLLLGVALLYLASGSLYLDQVATALAGKNLTGSVRSVAVLGVLFAAAGVAFKLSAVPFHLWTPDTYAGAPLPIAAFLSVVSKAAGLAALVVLLGIGVPGLASVWAPAIGVLAVLTMTVGNLVALRQHVAVRLLAWSTVAQAGWVLLPLAAASRTTPLGEVASGAVAASGSIVAQGSGVRGALAASLGYLVAYSAASLAAFGVVVLLARHVPSGEEHTLDAYRGLARREPVAAAVLGFALACLAGLPPGVMGLVAKVVAVRPLVDAGAWVFSAVAAVNVVLGLAYYLRWGALLVAAPDGEPPTWRVKPAEGLALGASAVACVGFSVAPQVVAGLLPGLLR